MWPYSHQDRLLKGEPWIDPIAAVALGCVFFIQQLYGTPSLCKSLNSPPKGDIELQKMFLLMSLLKINLLAHPVTLRNVNPGTNCSFYHFLERSWEILASHGIIVFPKLFSLLDGYVGPLEVLTQLFNVW